MVGSQPVRCDRSMSPAILRKQETTRAPGMALQRAETEIWFRADRHILFISRGAVGASRAGPMGDVGTRWGGLPGESEEGQALGAVTTATIARGAEPTFPTGSDQSVARTDSFCVY
jgi:hypothetical protein